MSTQQTVASQANQTTDKNPAAPSVGGSSRATTSANKVTIDIYVKETQKKLCTVRVLETDTITKVKEEIIRKNKKVIVKNLYI